MPWPQEIHFLNRFMVPSFPVNIGGNALVIKGLLFLLYVP